MKTTITPTAAAVQPLKPALDDATTLVEWHVASMGNHQGLIIDANGHNVAVAYDKTDAPLIAAAPELLKALQYAVKHLEHIEPANSTLSFARAAVAKATGGSL